MDIPLKDIGIKNEKRIGRIIGNIGVNPHIDCVFLEIHEWENTYYDTDIQENRKIIIF